MIIIIQRKMFNDLEKIFFNSKTQQLYAMLITHRIICLSAFCNDEYGVSLSKKYITNKITGDQKTSKRIVEILCDNEIINPINNSGQIEISYQINKFAQRYVCRYQFSGKLISIHTEDFVKGKYHEKFLNRYTKTNSETKWHQDNIKNNFKIDFDNLLLITQRLISKKIKAKSVEELKRDLLNITFKTSNPNYLKCKNLRYSILNLLDLDYNKITVGKNSQRHYSILTKMNSILRFALQSNISEKPCLSYLDIKNSQPFILLCLIKKEGLIIQGKMQNSILAGKFYQCIGECWQYNKTDVESNSKIRKEVKEKVFRYLLFKKTINLNSRIANIKKQFPIFVQNLIKISSKYDSLAKQLQKLEAEIMLPIIQEVNGIGLHDGVIFNTVNNSPEEFQIVENKIKKKFETNYGIKPSFSRTKISNTSKKQLVEYINNQDKEAKLNAFLATLTSDQLQIIKCQSFETLNNDVIIQRLRNQTLSYIFSKIIKSNIEIKNIGKSYQQFYRIFNSLNEEDIIKQRDEFIITTGKSISILKYILQVKKMKKELISTFLNHQFYRKKFQITWYILKHHIKIMNINKN